MFWPCPDIPPLPLVVVLLSVFTFFNAVLAFPIFSVIPRPTHDLSSVVGGESKALVAHERRAKVLKELATQDKPACEGLEIASICEDARRPTSKTTCGASYSG